MTHDFSTTHPGDVMMAPVHTVAADVTDMAPTGVSHTEAQPVHLATFAHPTLGVLRTHGEVVAIALPGLPATDPAAAAEPTATLEPLTAPVTPFETIDLAELTSTRLAPPQRAGPAALADILQFPVSPGQAIVDYKETEPAIGNAAFHEKRLQSKSLRTFQRSKTARYLMTLTKLAPR